jgi:hypothetical protein
MRLTGAEPADAGHRGDERLGGHVLDVGGVLPQLRAQVAEHGRPVALIELAERLPATGLRLADERLIAGLGRGRVHGDHRATTSARLKGATNAWASSVDRKGGTRHLVCRAHHASHSPATSTRSAAMTWWLT